MAQEIELSIAETNKLRAQLGLPLIPDPDVQAERSTTSARKLNESSANKLRKSLGLRQREEVEIEENDSKEESEVKKKLEKTKEKAPAKPQIDFLYDEIESTDDWLANLGKKKAETAQVTKNQHKKSDEQTFQLAHNASLVGELKDGDVLTLEDADVVGEDEEDILANDTLTKLSKVEKNKMEREKQALLEYGLRPNFEDEPKTQTSSVRVEGRQIVVENKPVDNEEASQSTKAMGSKVSFDFDELDEPRAPVTMKKAKKSKKSSKKRLRDDEDEIAITGSMVTTLIDADVEEDDELELMLAKSRQKKQKQRKHMSAEEIANEVTLHARADAVSVVGDGFVYDDTKDFLDSISVVKPAESVTENGKLDETIHTEQKLEEKSVPIAENDNAEAVLREGSLEQPDQPEGQSSGPQFSSLLDTLKYIRLQSDPEALQASQAEKLNRQAYQQAELNRIKISIEERLLKEELEKDHSYNSLDKEEQEKLFDRLLNDRLVAKGIIAELTSGKYSRYSKKPDSLFSYNPQVKLQYTDNAGQVLNTKQAWKHLLHKYHGLQPKDKKKKPVAKETRENIIG